MIKIKHIFLITTLLCFWSCSKDELNGDKEILIGKWKFHHTVKKIWRGYGSTYDTLLTINGSKNYLIEFKRKGKVVFCKNGNTEEKRIIFESYDETESYFRIHLNNDKNSLFIGSVKNDTLITRTYFPIEDPDDSGSGGTDYFNYFIRE